MGILTGSTRLRRYNVVGTPPEDLLGAIRANAFQGFGENDPTEKVAGWTAIRDWSLTDLQPSDYLIGGGLCLALRIDSRKVPARLLREESKKLEAEWKLKLGRESLSRAERDEIREIVHLRLLERALPATRGLDMAWHFERGSVLFWSATESVNELFRALFEKTFDVKLRPVLPFVLALRTTDEESLRAAGPCAFVEV